MTIFAVLFLVGNFFSDTTNSLYALALIAASYPAFYAHDAPPDGMMTSGEKSKR